MNEKQDITTEFTDIENYCEVNCYELYANKLGNLEEMNYFVLGMFTLITSTLFLRFQPDQLGKKRHVKHAHCTGEK